MDVNAVAWDVNCFFSSSRRVVGEHCANLLLSHLCILMTQIMCNGKIMTGHTEISGSNPQLYDMMLYLGFSHERGRDTRGSQKFSEISHVRNREGSDSDRRAYSNGCKYSSIGYFLLLFLFLFFETPVGEQHDAKNLFSSVLRFDDVMFCASNGKIFTSRTEISS